MERLKNALEKKAGRNIELACSIDESLIGGVRLEIGDYVYDGSVASRLGALVGQ
jgi:F-type H+-transporting ATPase subunit delta